MTYNAAPTQQLPIVIEDHGTRIPVVVRARWGLIPTWWKEAAPPTSTINARSEDAPAKPMWREAWRTRRCLVPATHYYEWMKTQEGKLPQALTDTANQGFMFAGLWASRLDAAGEPQASFAILTRAAAPALVHIHERMPVILAPQIWRLWIDRDLTDADAVSRLLRANTEIDVRAFAVGTRVNAPRNDDPGLLDPV